MLLPRRVAAPHLPRDTNPGRVNESEGYGRPGIAGSGAIACGVAATASALGEVRLWARSDQSAWRAEERAETECKKVEGGAAGGKPRTTKQAELAACGP